MFPYTEDWKDSQLYVAVSSAAGTCELEADCLPGHTSLSN